MIGPDGAGKSTFIQERFSETANCSLKKDNSSSCRTDQRLMTVYARLENPILSECYLLTVVYSLELLRNTYRILFGDCLVFDRSPIDRVALVIEQCLRLYKCGFKASLLLRVLLRLPWLLPNFLLALVIGRHILLLPSAETLRARRPEDYPNLIDAELKRLSYVIISRIFRNRLNIYVCGTSGKLSEE